MLWLRQIQLFFCNHSNMRKSCLIWCSHRTRAWMCFVKRLWSHQCCSSCLATNIKDVDFPRGKPQFSLIKINMPERSWDGSSRGSRGKQHRDRLYNTDSTNFLLTFLKKICINNSPKKVLLYLLKRMNSGNHVTPMDIYSYNCRWIYRWLCPMCHKATKYKEELRYDKIKLNIEQFNIFSFSRRYLWDRCVLYAMVTQRITVWK